jgi:ribose transport system permease protein
VIARPALSALFTIQQPGLGSPGNVGNVSSQLLILWIMATGTTFAIASGEVDLSIGSTFALCAIGFAHSAIWI